VIDQYLVAAPDGQRVAFSRSCLVESRACTPGLLVVGRAGRTLRRLAPDAVPGAWSPDGRQLAYVTVSGDGIFVVSADGKRRRRLTRGYDGSPAWSPDGAQIGFLHGRSAGASTRELILIGADGRGRRSLARSSSGPAWSPDGRRLLFERDGTIYLVPSAGGTARRVGPGYQGGGWSPDGRLLALPLGRRIDLATAEGTMRRPLDTGRSRVRPYVHQPTWSPDGKWLAFVRSAEEGKSAEIWVIRPDGTGRRRIAAPGREVQLAWTR
jgi:TolB protein